ncbi:Hypothetical predicted protein [Mytilus galloprovincialis]|uniref:Chromo domain-containing protein n=1 Tax=Mytilus galloprovincialis TaxID=29158 RepID=A0A8B6EU54_MYTGA|nr:Hypothetical predicted protein [Mytilus galloprovincialis]
MFNNSKKPLKQGKTPANYHQEIQCDIESAFDNLDLFTKKTNNVISFKPDHPPSYPVDDNDTTIPYVEDQPFFQSSPIHSNKNHFLSSWTGQPTLPSSITPLRPSIVHRPSIPSTFAKRPAPTTNSLQTPQHVSSLLKAYKDPKDFRPPPNLRKDNEVLDNEPGNINQPNPNNLNEDLNPTGNPENNSQSDVDEATSSQGQNKNDEWHEAIKLLKLKWISGKKHYLVQWKDNSNPTWEPQENVSEPLKIAFHSEKARKRLKRRR